MADPQHPVVITDIEVPFTRLVVFFVKAGLASIPALIIIYAVLALLFVVGAAMFDLSVRPGRG
jgi:hypothetical protein